MSEGKEVEDYHLRVTDPSQTEMWVGYINSLNTVRTATVIEKKGTKKSHIHSFLTIDNSQVTQIRDFLRKGLKHVKGRGAYSLAKRRNNLLAYCMKELPCEIEEVIETAEKNRDNDNVELKVVHNTENHYFYSLGFSKQELLDAYQKSYPKDKDEIKASFEISKSLWLSNWQNQYLSHKTGAYLCGEKLCNRFIEDLVDFYTRNHKCPPRFSYVAHLCLKYQLITAEQYRIRMYPNFF